MRSDSGFPYLRVYWHSGPYLVNPKNQTHPDPPMKGIILDKASFDRGDIDLSPIIRCQPPLAHEHIQWTYYDSTSNELAAGRIGDADIVITNKVRVDANAIEQAKQLKLIILAATGTDNVDLNAASAKGIVVSNTRDYSTPAVVQHVFTLILNLTTNVIQYQQMVKNQKWQTSEVFCLLDHPIRELEQKRMGIIGYGSLGRRVAHIAQAFGMQVNASASMGASRNRTSGGASEDIQRLDLDELLSQSDVISIHCPLTDQTRHLISEREFDLMKSSAILINTARGAIVDSQALVNALNNGQIAGAGVDVLDREPPNADHPLIANRLDNLIVTPHNAWASFESRQRLVNQMSHTLQGWLDGQPQNVVTP